MTISQVTAPVQPHANYERLIARAKQVPPATTVVVYPCDETSLRGVAEAAEAGIIIPILVGPKARIAALARQHGIDIRRFELIDAIFTPTKPPNRPSSWSMKRKASCS